MSTIRNSTKCKCFDKLSLFFNVGNLVLDLRYLSQPCFVTLAKISEWTNTLASLETPSSRKKCVFKDCQQVSVQ